ncbi:MAG TPA: protein kinase [Candidatus Dormibacteraeota bacterium]|nr:protein kinase [Candidatus Dormibacteraeota bacterium]
MSLIPGTRFGPYEIIGPAGAGGMGEVYRARDVRLDRTVAIKVIPAHLCSAPDLKQRFDREAKAISQISHSHICALHDIGSQDGTDFLVLEYLEGETLQQRLQKGPLPLEQVLRYAIEIAGALDTAHHQGIIHRDLKPANIMLTKSGAKLLDFGLARLIPRVSPVEAELTAMTADDRQITEKGTIIGTFQYMAPEQLEGKEADARTDIFAFGAVMYEMLTGKPAFTGRSKASLIAAILSLDPSTISSLQPTAPPALDRVIRTCLAKEPDERFQSAHDLHLQLSWMDPSRDHASPSTTHALRSGISLREKLAWAALLVLVAALLFFAPAYFHTPAGAPTQMVRSSLLPPPDNSFVPYNFAISPDGTRLAFVSLAPDGHTQLWVRSLDAAGAQQLSGTEDAIYPFWAPDNRRIAFFASAKLKVFDLGRSSVQTICDASRGRGGTWNRDDVIVFAPDIVGPLYRVGGSGGVPVPVTKLPRKESGQAHRWPSFLPDGRHFVFLTDWSSTADPQGNGTYIGSLDSGDTSMLSADITGAAHFSSGYLVYVSEHSLLAQPFDLAHLRLTGSVIPLAHQELEQDFSFGSAGFSISENAVVAFRSESDAPSHLVWFDRTGKELVACTN